MSHQPSAASNQQKLQQKRDRVHEILRDFERVIIAFSGGVDSTLLAALARQQLGRPNVVAATADSPSLARADLDDARRLAVWIDVEHVIVATQEVSSPAYRANTAARCYFCKRELFDELHVLARERGVPAVLYGAIGDDVAAERPGQRAAAEAQARAPLQEAGLEKWEVRELARQLGVPNWNRPQNACLSSRIPHGQPVTEEKLRMIEQAEAVLLELGFRQVRVRHLDGHARIEVGPEEVGRLDEPDLQQEISQRLLPLGFHSVGVAKQGYQPGGANHGMRDERLLQANDQDLITAGGHHGKH